MTDKLIVKLNEMIKDAECHNCNQLAVKVADLKELIKLAEVNVSGPETSSNIAGTESAATLCTRNDRGNSRAS